MKGASPSATVINGATLPKKCQQNPRLPPPTPVAVQYPPDQMETTANLVVLPLINPGLIPRLLSVLSKRQA